MRVQAFDGTFMGMMRARQVYISSKLFYGSPAYGRFSLLFSPLDRDKQTLPVGWFVHYCNNVLIQA